MSEGSRAKWAAFAVLLMMLAGGVAVVALAGSGGDDTGSLKVERYSVSRGVPELLISVSRNVNVPDTAKTEGSVGFACVDGSGKRVLGGRVNWPFIEEPGFPLPHIHQPATEDELRRISICRLSGTTVELEGRMGLSR